MINPISVVAVGLTAFAVCLLVRSSLEAKRNEKYDQDLLLIFDGVSRSLQAGSGLQQAFLEASDSRTYCGEDFSMVVNRIKAGSSVREALEIWSDERRRPAVSIMCAAIACAVESGGSYVGAIESATDVLRGVLHGRDVVRTHVAQVQMSMLTMTALPLLLLVIMTASDAQARHFLFGTTLGGVILSVGLMLDVLGAFLLIKLVKMATE